MLVKTITYTDLDGRERTEEFRFHLSKAELIQTELSGKNNSFTEELKEIGKSNNGALIMSTFERLILATYGIKNDDGGFEKSPEITARFKASEAYSELYTELCTDASAAAAFLNGVVPANLQAEVARMKAAGELEGAVSNGPELTPVAPVLDSETSADRDLSEYTVQDYIAMPQDEWNRRVGSDPQTMTKEQLQAAFLRKSQS